MDFSTKKVLTFEEGCQYLGYKKSYVYKLTHNKILPFSKPNGKSIFFEKERLENWMLSNASNSQAERKIEAATYVKTKGGVTTYEK
jgi:prophage regulatory protein